MSLKKVLTIGAFVLTLVSITWTQAGAAVIGGYRISGTNSIAVDSILKQLKNADVTVPSYEVVLFLQRVSLRCTNPAGNTEGANNGQPFNLDEVTVGATQTNDDFAITKNGRALSEIIFHDPELVEAVLAGLPPDATICKQNWSVVLDKIVVHEMQAFGTLFTCANGGDPTDPRNTGCTIEDALAAQCAVPSNLTLQQLFSSLTFDYNCTTLCHNSEGTQCPQPPAEIEIP